jgi:hypothetical protein
MWKEANDPLNCMTYDSFNDYTKLWDSSWFVIGHTRAATRGNVTRKNAHPFRRGKWVGVHNGIISAPTTCEVDSMHLWEQLKRYKGDYQKAWENIWGNWGLAWYDGNHVYLQAHDQSLASVTISGVTYFSSDHRHLSAVTGVNECWDYIEGETWKYLKNGSCVECPIFEENLEVCWVNRKNDNVKFINSPDHFKHVEKMDNERAWDHEAWDEYVRDYDNKENHTYYSGSAD